MSEETKKLADQLRADGLDATAHIVELKAENKSQAKRIEELKRQIENAAQLRDAKILENRELGDVLRAANAELKEENTALRATAELAWLSLRDYTMAQSRMSDGWDRASESAKRQLLKDLHFCEAGGREAMQAIMDNKAHPTTNPTDSDGSGT